MSLTTQSFTYALNNIEELTKFIQNRATNIINDKDNDFDENTIFVIFTMFGKGFFTTYLLPETEFQNGVLFDPYALNKTVLAVTSGKTLINDYNQVKSWFTAQLTQSLTETQTLDKKADAVSHR